MIFDVRFSASRQFLGKDYEVVSSYRRFLAHC